MKRIVIAIALAVLALTACSDRYSIEAGAIQTPAPPPTPQVIVIDRPVPTPASQDNGALIVIAVILIAGTMMASGVAIGYIARSKPEQQPSSSVPQSLTLTTNNYYSTQPPAPPAQLTEAEQFAILRKMGHSPESARNMIVSGVARQICAPK